MITVNLYQPGKINCDINFPSDWNELLPEELLIICKQQLAKFESIQQQVAAIFNDIILFRAKPFKKQLPKNFQLLVDPEDASINGLPLVNFLYKENRLTTQLFPIVKLSNYRIGKLFHGPESNFDNLTCGEFEDAEIFFQEFIKKPGEEPAAHLAAILWRPKNTPYMRWHAKQHKWITYNHEQYLKRFMQLPVHQLYAFFVWYSGCRSILPLIFPAVYKSDNSAKKTNR